MMSNYPQVDGTVMNRYFRKLYVAGAGAAVLTLGAGICAGNSAAVKETSQRPPTINDLIDVEASIVEAADVSADGNWIAYQLRGNAVPEVLDQPIYVRSLHGKGPPTRVDEGLLPKWSPDGTRLAYYTTRDQRRQLWIYDRKQGVANELTRVPGGIVESDQARYNGYTLDPYSFSWSPNGKYIAFPTYATHEGSTSASTPGTPVVLDGKISSEADELRGVFNARDVLIERAIGMELGRRGSPELLVVDVVTGNIATAVDSSTGCFNPAWSPRGTQIACVSTKGAPIGSASKYSPTQLLLVESDGFSNRELTTLSNNVVKMPVWSPDGLRIAYLESDIHPGRLQPCVLSLREHSTRRFLTEPVVSVIWNKDGSALLAADGRQILSIDLTMPSGRVRTIIKPSGLYIPPWGIFAVGRQSVVYVALGDNEKPASVLIVNPRNGVVTSVFSVGPDTSKLSLGKHVLVRWRNKNGENLEAVLILPLGHRTGERFPLIVDVYPSDTGKRVKELNLGVMGGNEALAANGYGVFFPAWRAPHVWMNSVRSQRFAEAAKGPSGWDVTYDDIMTGVDEVIAHYDVDPRRMCLFGFSNGGLVADYLITRTDKFACAVSVSAVPPDWVTPYLVYSEFDIQNALGLSNSPFDDLQAYIALSPIYSLKSVSTPVLLAAGDNEWSAVLTTLEMYVGLKRLNKDVTFLRYPNQWHGFVGDAARDFWERYNAFFAKYLFPDGAQRSPSKS